MKVLLAVLLVALALAEARRSSSNHTEFMTKHKKTYRSPAEATRRAAIWAQHKTKIDSHNALHAQGKVSYSLTDNPLADQGIDEIVKGLILPPRPRTNELVFPENRQTPSFLNLTTSACMPPIKNQGACGSCWAFAAVDPVDYQYCVKRGSLTVFSEQHLVACANNVAPNAGCDGGWPGSAWTYIKNNGGLATAAAIPYASAGGTSPGCTFTASQGVAQVSGWGYVAQDEVAIAQAIANNGPVAVAIYVNNNFQLYSSGIYNDPTCMNMTVNHAVTLVGYGNSTCGGAFWILRNSWGTSWGMRGYMLMARGVNMCSVAQWAHQPVVV